MTTLNEVKSAPLNTENTDSELCQIKRHANPHVFTRKMDGSIGAVELKNHEKKKPFLGGFFCYKTSDVVPADEQMVLALARKNLRDKTLTVVTAPVTEGLPCFYQTVSTKLAMHSEYSPTSITMMPDKPQTYAAVRPVPEIVEDSEFDAKQWEQYREQDEETFKVCLSF